MQRNIGIITIQIKNTSSQSWNPRHMLKTACWQYSMISVSLLIKYQALECLLVITEVIRGSDMRFIVEHHLAMNLQLESIDDSDNDCIAQIVQTMCLFSSLKKWAEYLKNIKLFMPRMSGSSDIYQVLSDNRMVPGLCPLCKTSISYPHHTITLGLTIAHISQ